jgi:putative phage-type endonuclease
VEQRSDEWFEATAGSLGASKIGVAIGRLKRSGERTAAAVDLMFEIAAARLTGLPAKQNNPRWWGIEHEDEARRAYAFLTNLPVVQIGLIPHPTIPNAHASPDSLVGDEGGLELKCPTSATHLHTLLDDAVPEDHLPQLHWAMACSARQWWDFVSYDPRFPSDMQLFVKRVLRDEVAIATLEAEARLFIGEVNAKLDDLYERYPI